MDYLNHFIEFADGDLSPEMEKNLFANLASDENMRNEFRRHLAIKNAIASKGNLFTPPIDSALSIFSKIGLEYPAAPLAIPVAEVAKTGFINHFLSNKVAYSSLLAACFGGFIVYLFMLNSNINSLNELNQAKSELSKLNSQLINNKSQSNSEIARISSINTDKENQIALLKDNLSNSKNTNKLLTNKLSTINTIKKENTQTIATTIPVEIKPEEYKIDYAKIEQNKNVNSIQNLPTQLTYNEPILVNRNTNVVAHSNNQDFGDYPKWAVELMGANYWNNADLEANAKSANFSNTSIAIMYNFSEYVSILADIRQETFFLKFSNTDESNRMNQYILQPNLTSGNIGLRFRYPITNNIIPLTQFNFGVNQYGVVERSMFGFELAPYRNVGLILGYELNWMQFQSKNSLFETRKSGLHFGMSYKF